MKKIIVYFPYEIKEPKSGSMVRPQKMLKAFKEYCKLHNYELIAIHGESNLRKQKIKSLVDTVNPKEIIFAYMENSTLPYWLTDEDHIPRNPLVEINFFKYLKRNSIPIGLFYRDIYWKFEEYSLKGIKRFIMRIIYHLELLVYKNYLTKMFLPSIQMNDFVGFYKNKIQALPPAGENSNYSILVKEKLSVIYVGGISESYGIKELLLATNNFSKKKQIELHLVCRKDELNVNQHIFSEFRNEKWLNIHHKSGEGLKEIYKQANVAIVPRPRNIYNDFAVPVKLFEYMSYGLPIIATNCVAQAEILNKNSVGKIVTATVDGIEEGFEYFSIRENRDIHTIKTKEALVENNLWVSRVQEIADSLTNEIIK